MKSSKLHLILILVLMILTMQIISANSATESVNIGITHGTEAGEIDGEEAGLSDQDKGYKPDWRRNFPTVKALKEKYNLSKSGPDYENQFVASYRKAYELSYTKSFLDSGDKLKKKKDAKTRSHDIGFSEGAALAATDLARRSKSDWDLAYNRFLRQGPIRSRYNLEIESEEFIKTFEINFKEGFKAGYTESFTDKILEHTEANINFVLVGRRGGELVHNTDNISIVSSSVGAENTSDFVVKIPENAILQDTYMSVSMLESYANHKNSEFLDLTPPYYVSVGSDNRFVKLYKPITVSINYTGNSRGGIYKWDGYRWLYQYTKFEEGKAITEVEPQDYKGAYYALMFDDKFVNPKDAWSNRLNKEIIIAYKRRYVPQVMYFNPNAKMTYLEYADLVYKAYRYKTLYTEKPRYIVNQDDIKGYEPQVQFAIAMGYLPLGDDNTFDAFGNVTYSQLQTLVHHKLGHEYEYKTIADNMLQKRFYRSDFLTGKSVYPTKAEVVYTVVETTK